MPNDDEIEIESELRDRDRFSHMAKFLTGGTWTNLSERSDIPSHEVQHANTAALVHAELMSPILGTNMRCYLTGMVSRNREGRKEAVEYSKQPSYPDQFGNYPSGLPFVAEKIKEQEKQE